MGSDRQQRRCHRLLGLLVGAAATLSCVGCGNGLASVSGQVSVDGQPLVAGDDVRGTVYYFPEGGSGVPAAGLLDEQGNYQLSTGSQAGVTPGAYLVSVSAVKLIPNPIEGEAPGGQPMLPRRYADPTKSGFRVQVEAGSNQFDFSIDSTPDPSANPRRKRR